MGSNILGIKDPKVKILKDPSLGRVVQLPSRIQRMMDNTISALTLAPGETGERYEFKSGLKANLVEILAAIRLARRYSNLVKVSKKEHTTLDDLKRVANLRAGLQERGLETFTQIYVKSIFNEVTKPNNLRFPGLWLNSLKKANDVNHNVGIIYKMGYELKIANAQKVLTVVRNRPVSVTVSEPSKVLNRNNFSVLQKAQEKTVKEVVLLNDQNNPEGITHQEFRLGAFLLLPLIDPKADISPKDQISRDPLAVRDKTVLEFYNRNRDVVDATNLAYAIKASLGRKGSRATPSNYEVARNRALALTANRPWMDMAGNTYTRLQDIPENIRRWLLSFLRRKTTSREDAKEDDSSSQGNPESQDETEDASGSSDNSSSGEDRSSPPEAGKPQDTE